MFEISNNDATKYQKYLLRVMSSFERKMRLVRLKMPLTIVCHGCGRVLYEGNDMVSPYEIRVKTDGRCPACGRKLAISPLGIILESVEE